MKIRKSSVFAPLVAVAVLAFPLAASAVPITGAVGFGGAFLPTGGTDLSDATGLDFIFAQTLAGVGDYSGVPAGTATIFSDFQFNPLTPAPVSPLWAFSFGGVDYSFNLAAVDIDLQNANELNLSGSGTLMATGFDNTAGTWVFSGDSTGSIVFTFSSITAAAVPEPATLFLMGLGLAGIGTLRRKLK